jgi:putative ribosome biogenesis GTPase RsgA
MTHALVKQKLTAKQLSYKPTAVIMGKTGVRKTTLGNKLCGTFH